MIRFETWARLILGCLVVWMGYTLYQNVKQQGWNERDAQAQLEKARAVTSALQELEKSILDAKKRDQQVLDDLQLQLTRSEMRASSLQARMQLQAKTPYQPTETKDGKAPQPPLVGQSVLDDSTVRMLNDARAGRSSLESAALGSHEESGALTATAPYVTGVELVLNDHKVVTLYHQLATRHNALVDWVENQCARPAAVTP